MPNPATHIEMAHRAARQVGASVIDTNMGYYLLGSTAPDVRVITKKGRKSYHFASLDFDEVGAGVSGLFQRYPTVRTVDHEPTRAFIAGYIAHLILDETWIATMYRPHFGVNGIFETEAHGAVMDRAMQLELDSIALEDLSEPKAQLAEFDGGIDVPFIDESTLVVWHNWVTDFVAQEFSWQRLRFMARRIARGDESHPAHRIADEFVRGMTGTLDVLHEAVPRERLEEFRNDSITAVASRVEEYLA